ncbi:hypothetical protein AG0111_0g1916 [Alternaria gaisen]|uniref:Uncharacterized protein n=1 Tax=Alternaria gaisen TaxID=167740 RepID=A0ACB6G443_9PLEO|nr:hypothetical protein AG0111_0g1916 [Alternaria gaisen]
MGEHRSIAGLRCPATHRHIFCYDLITEHSFYKPTATSQRHQITTEHSKQHLKPDGVRYNNKTERDYAFHAWNSVFHPFDRKTTRSIV